jgi:hypothetical protein
MKTCSNHFPDCKVLLFQENPQRKKIYDLKTASAPFEKFKYFRLQTPKQPYLIKQGAKYVCESWTNSTKVLHTGLISAGIDNYYFGDHREQHKTSLMIFHFVPETSTIQIYYFNHFSKKSISMTFEFCRAYIETTMKKGDVSASQCSNHNQRQTLGMNDKDTKIL